ncbi:hypothetical protein [Clostridium gasigenes]|uniref:ABC-2 type transport system permease protein n=1 Tax=Clostridium gasigenes TaxID=94869 RepID=A0A7X0SAD4_9CLOT|nr:hypothetical protein [Clostridium gasigenes]MBB6713991.1 hypothetical protein [Clostridium gasigenes]
MKEFKVLKIIDKFKGIYKKAGIDYEVMRLIISTKLLMDGRRTSVAFNNGKKQKPDSNQFTKALMMYAFMGFFLMMTLVIKINIMYQLSVYFGGFMFLILTVFISDFSSVILDVKDKNLIGSKGISLKTVNAAKLTHVFIYMMYLTIALGGFSILVSARYGIWFMLVFILEIILIDLFMVIVTALIYFLVLKFFDGEKLKDMINVVQIVLSLTMVVGGQIIPRLFNVMDLKITYTPKLWHYLFPPMWFAAPLEMIDSGHVNGTLIAMSILAVVMPIVSIVIYIKLAPTFEQYLQKLNNNTYKSKSKKEKLSFRISKIICRNKEERVFFNFTNSIISSERSFKLKAYPVLGLAIIFPFIFMSIGMHEFAGIMEWRAKMVNSKSFISLYGVAIMIPNILILLRYSEMYKAGWVYTTMPIKNTSSIFKGSIKAVMYKLLAPVFIFQSIVFIIIFSPKVIVQIVGVLLASILLIMIIFMTMEKALPFTQKQEVAEVSGNILPVIITMLSTGLLVGTHFAVTFIPIGIYIYILILIIVDMILWSKVFNVKWKSLK